jgi:hypothetical protein
MANEGIMAAPMPMQQQQPPQGYVSSLDAYNAASSAMQETNPQAFGEYKSAIGSKLSQLNLKPSEIEAFVTLLEYMMQYPDQYKEIIRAGIEAGAIEEGDFPAEFDQSFVSTLLAALNEQRIQQAQNVSPEAMGPGPQEPMAMKSGGLADAAKALQARGRGRDTVLAHITPQEAEMLRKAGGLGTRNPYTGLPEYGFFSDAWKAVTAPVKAVVNVVKDVAKSPIGRIALTIGATMALGPLAAGFGIGTAGTAAIVGGGMSALSGGNLQDVLKGAAMGYIGGTVAPYASQYLPGAAGSVLNQGLTGAALGTGFGLASGMSAKDALKAGAVGGLTGAGVAYGQQQGYLPSGQPAGSRTTAPTDAAADGSNLSLAPIEGTGTVGTATENLTPVMRQDALSGQQFSVGMDGKEYLVYKDAAGNNQYVRADAVNTSQPMAPSGNLSVADKYSPYYTGEPAAPVDNFLISNQQVDAIRGSSGYTPNLSAQSQYLMKTPTDYSLGTASDYTQAQGMSPGAGSGLQPSPSVSLSGGFNAPRGGVGLLSAGAGNAPGLTIPAQQDALSFSSPDVVAGNQSQLTPQQIESYVTKPTAFESFTEGAKGLYNKAADAVTGGYSEYLSPSRPSIQQAEQAALLKADQAVADYQANSPKPTQMGAEAAYKAAYESNSPGFMSKYAPLAGATLGATYLAGGFDKPTTPGDDTPVYDPAYTGTEYIRDNPQAFSGSLYNYQSQGAGAYDPSRVTTYEGGQGAAAPGVVAPTGIMQAQYSPEYGRRRTQALQRYYSPFIGTAEPIMAAKGGSIREFPRKTGPINGPGTGTSDDIPAMLSDGEFVFTARAVRNAGGGSRRKGAARMYKLMKSLEKGGMVKG